MAVLRRDEESGMIDRSLVMESLYGDSDDPDHPNNGTTAIHRNGTSDTKPTQQNYGTS